MADLKISQLSDGGNAQATDEYVVARSGANYRIDGASVAAAATSVGTLTSLTVANTTAAATAASFSGNYNASGSVTVGNFQRSGGAVASAIKYHDATTSMSFGTTTAHTLTLRTNDTDRVSFDSSGNVNFDSNTLYVDAANNRVGVGTATPGTALEVGAGSGSPFARINGSTTAGQGGGFMIARAGTEIGGVFSGSWATSGAGPLNSVFVGTTTAEALLFGINYTEKMRLDASGNLGLGVTPSAWNSAYKTLDFSWASLSSENVNQGGMRLNVNAYADSSGYNNWYRKQAAHATSYKQNDGVHSWYTAGSAAAGTSITFTQAMTLDASGNLGVGTTPSYKLDVDGAGRLGLINRNVSYVQGTTTPSAAGVSAYFISNSSATTITNFTNGVAGQVLFLKFSDANTTINRSNAYLAGGVNFVSTTNSTLVLMSDGTFWYEICRSTTNS